MDKMGTKMFAQAVLLATSVTNVETSAIMKLISSGSSSLKHEKRMIVLTIVTEDLANQFIKQFVR